MQLVNINPNPTPCNIVPKTNIATTTNTIFQFLKVQSITRRKNEFNLSRFIIFILVVLNSFYANVVVNTSFLLLNKTLQKGLA